MKLTRAQLTDLRQRSVAAGGNRLAAALELADATQVSLAKQTGLPYSYVSDVTRCRYDGITVANASKFAACFGCHIEDLFPTSDQRVSA